jgi:three-Cys-motif partner protein
MARKVALPDSTHAELPFTVEEIEAGHKDLRKPLGAPVWTASKASIIKVYLELFVKVTFRGTYIDAFAGHQYEDHQAYWAAKLAWQGNPGPKRRRIDRFELFEKSAKSVANLRSMIKETPADGRVCFIHPGDCNIAVPKMLATRPVTGPAFCLLDQRTTQCTWDLVRTVSQHKAEGTKIELFYFLMASWKDRSLKNRSEKRDADLQAWWGRGDFECLFEAKHMVMQERFVERFQNELGYRYVRSYPIADRHAGCEGGAIHYYMIHASDHPEAPKFMMRSYNKVANGYNPNAVQPSLGWSGDDLTKIGELYRRKGVVKKRK